MALVQPTMAVRAGGVTVKPRPPTPSARGLAPPPRGGSAWLTSQGVCPHDTHGRDWTNLTNSSEWNCNAHRFRLRASLRALDPLGGVLGASRASRGLWGLLRLRSGVLRTSPH